MFIEAFLDRDNYIYIPVYKNVQARHPVTL